MFFINIMYTYNRSRRGVLYLECALSEVGNRWCQVGEGQKGI